MPALFTKISTEPNVEIASFIIACTESLSATFACTAIASVPNPLISSTTSRAFPAQLQRHDQFREKRLLQPQLSLVTCYSPPFSASIVDFNDVRSLTAYTVARRLTFFTRPDNTFPGPISTNVSTPSARSVSTVSSHLTGEYSCSTSLF